MFKVNQGKDFHRRNILRYRGIVQCALKSEADVEIEKKGHLWMKTICNVSLSISMGFVKGLINDQMG